MNSNRSKMVTMMSKTKKRHQVNDKRYVQFKSF